MKCQNLFTGVVFAFLVIAITSTLSFAQDQEKEKISIAKKAGIGSYLVNSAGKTLYYYKNDSANKSTCWEACAEKWPVYCYKTHEIAVGKGLKLSDFSHFIRSGADTLEHLTYKGKPLYEYNGDAAPGDTNGQGVDNLWFVVQP